MKTNSPKYFRNLPAREPQQQFDAGQQSVSLLAGYGNLLPPKALLTLLLGLFFSIGLVQAETIEEAFRVMQGQQQQVIELQQKQIPLRTEIDNLQTKIESEKVRNAEVIKEYRTARRELESARYSGEAATLKNAQFNFMLAERRYEKSSGPLESYREKLKKALASLSENEAKIQELEEKIDQQNLRIAELNKKAPVKPAKTNAVVDTKALKASQKREKEAQAEIESLKHQLAEVMSNKFKTDPTAESRKHAIREAMRMRLMLAQSDPADIREDLLIYIQKIGDEKVLELTLKYKGSGQYAADMILELGEYRIKLNDQNWTANIPPIDHKANHSFVFDTTESPARMRVYNNQFIKELGVF